LTFRAAARPIAAWYQGLALKLVHGDPRESRKGDILLVAQTHNESLCTPFFFDYYRKLGVDRFLIVDNDSTGAFIDFARQRDDCCVWRIRSKSRRARHESWWRNNLLMRFGVGHLCLLVNTNEFLVYPYMATRSVRALGQFLKDDHRECAHALLVDAYSEKAPAETICRHGDNPFEICAYFDRDGYTQRSGPLNTTLIQGGPHMRVHFRDEPASSPTLDTMPLIWWQKNYRYLDQNWLLEPSNLNLAHRWGEVSLSCCLFRFENLVAPGDRPEQSADDRGDARADAAQTVLYRAGVSAKYEGPQQLVDLGLMCAGGWV
jgi:hypothetical protein